MWSRNPAPTVCMEPISTTCATAHWRPRHPFMDFKPHDQQQQFGFTLGGPIRRNRAFFFAGFDQHIFHIPTRRAF